MKLNPLSFPEFNQSVDQEEIKKLISNALSEDIGFEDITTDYIIQSDSFSSAKLVAKSAGVIAGLPLIPLILEDSGISNISDGQKVKPGDVIAEVQATARILLTRERVLLNFIQHLSGIATLTAQFVEAVKPYPVKILDTRKTTPMLRSLEKYAVRVGGGYNHRFGLYDQVLIKDNHIEFAGSITTAIARVKKQVREKIKIEVETKNLDEVQEALAAKVDIIMLDNMDIPTMEKAVKLINHQAVVEASGGINLQTVREIAATGVDMISVGALTHSAKALDINMKLD
jgi:nicotinate-nucleotide pyrophosphorylase (carboxylating)